MITYLKNELYSTGKTVAQIACLSTDTKPTDGIVTGSICLEVDTGDVYAYDEIGESWNKIS